MCIYYKLVDIYAYYITINIIVSTTSIGICNFKSMSVTTMVLMVVWNCAAITTWLRLSFAVPFCLSLFFLFSFLSLCCPEVKWFWRSGKVLHTQLLWSFSKSYLGYYAFSWLLQFSRNLFCSATKCCFVFPFNKIFLCHLSKGSPRVTLSSHETSFPTDFDHSQLHPFSPYYLWNCTMLNCLLAACAEVRLSVMFLPHSKTLLENKVIQCFMFETWVKH